jgi:hypothetical protein
MTPNSNFKANLVIRYQYIEEVPGAPPRLAMATVTGPVQSG